MNFHSNSNSNSQLQWFFTLIIWILAQKIVILWRYRIHKNCKLTIFGTKIQIHNFVIFSENWIFRQFVIFLRATFFQFFSWKFKLKYFWSILGIYGRLGDLGAIDKKYDVAISTAAGSQLDTLIVDNMDTGKKCIEYLKRHDIGRINALALDKTTRHAEKVQEKFKAPENAPRLIDLISVDQPHLKTAFYQYLRDTLVAENLEQAKRIAFGAQRFRVVTLSGEVIETSGAMAGGGSQKMSGKMGQQIATKKGLLFCDFFFSLFLTRIFLP